jgi:hypothetical protein
MVMLGSGLFCVRLLVLALAQVIASLLGLELWEDVSRVLLQEVAYALLQEVVRTRLHNPGRMFISSCRGERNFSKALKSCHAKDDQSDYELPHEYD